MKISRPRLLVVGAVLALVLVLVVSYGQLACREPIDVSGTTRLPDWLVALKERDEIAYPAHAIVGAVLNQAGCSPIAVGLQWLKAGAHARTEQEIMTAEQGLSVARARADPTATFDARLCAFMTDGYANTQQEAVTRGAGLRCQE